jgi:hypothetical protein
MATPTTKDEENNAAVEFMRVINPLIQKAAELGIVDADTMEFTDGFQVVVNSYPDNIQLHAAAILVINEWLRRTSQSVPDNLKIQLALFVLDTLLDGRMKFLEEQYSSLIKELERKG